MFLGKRIRILDLVIMAIMLSIACHASSAESKSIDITQVITKQEFLLYKDVGEFIDNSPKVTIAVQAEQTDIEEYGEGVVKTLTGTDCDRDGKMDDNQTCNAVYLKLWIKYQR